MRRTLAFALACLALSLPDAPRADGLPPGQRDRGYPAEAVVLEGTRHDVRPHANETTVTDPAGDFVPYYVYTEPLPSLSGTSLSTTFPKWYVSGVTFPALIQIDTPSGGVRPNNVWTGGNFMAIWEAGIVRMAQIQDLQSNYAMSIALGSPVPSPSTRYYYGYGFSNGSAWTGFVQWNNIPEWGGMQMDWGYVRNSNYESGRHDLVASTLRQVDGTTLELEITTAASQPSSPSPFSDERFLTWLYDVEGQTIDYDVRVIHNTAGWRAELTTSQPGSFYAAVVLTLPAPVVTGNRIRVRFPLTSLPVRDLVRYRTWSQALVSSELGPIYSSGLDYTAPGALTLSDPAEVVVSALPEALVQVTGQAGATSTATLTNVGDFDTTITLGRSGDFFVVAPQVFTLPARSSQQITITGVARPAGTYAGAIVPTGLGVPGAGVPGGGLTIPVRMLVAGIPSGTAKATPDSNRVDVAAPEGQNLVTGQIGFRNEGSGALTGIISSDVPWLAVASPVITLAPQQATTITFTVDRVRRPDSGALLGSAVGSLSLKYLTGSGAQALADLVDALNGGANVSTTLVTVTDTARPPVGRGAPPPLAAGEVAVFLAGVGHTTSSVGTFISDVHLSTAVPLPSLAVYYTATGTPLASSYAATLPAVSSLQPVTLADVTRSIFDVDGLGTLQIRGKAASVPSFAGTVFNKSNAAGTYGSAVPALRSDRAVGAGEAMYVTGLRAESARGRTNFIVQETAGVSTPFTIDLYDAAGNVIATRNEGVPGFDHLRINNAVPAGAVSAAIRVPPGAAGRVLAYATPLDSSSGDTWVATDWARVDGFPASAKQVIPVAGRLLGGNANFFRTSVSLMNPGSGAINVRLAFVPNAGAVTTRDVSLGARVTRVWEDVLKDLFALESGLGFIEIDPHGAAVALTSRTFATIGSDPRTFGTGVPAVPATAMGPGSWRRISGIDDAADSVVVAKTPATFRTNLGLVETSGAPATVRLTIHYRHPQSTRLTEVGSASRDIQLAPRQFMLLNSVSKEILGAYRTVLKGDLKNLFLEIQVINGGSVIAFTSSVDNGSADQVFKLE